jgi:REP element-mobilizing transposase RayT
MPNTYSQLYIQVVFAVQGRKSFIKESFREELQKYIAGIISGQKQKLMAIYCMPDHTHIFLSMKPNLCISDLVRDIKSNSSSFLKEKEYVNQFSWQEGFGAFSYSKSQAKNVIDYVLNQPERHKATNFKDEYIGLLEKFEIEFDEKYLFEFYD